MFGSRRATSSPKPHVAASQPLSAKVTPALDAILEAVLIVLLAFMPFAFGAIEPWAQSIVMFVVFTLSVGLLIRCSITPTTVLTKTWSVIPMILFVLLVAAQLIPLPESWVHLVSPHTVARKMELLSDMPNAADLLHRLTLSFYPLATEHDLRLVLAASTVFVTVLTVVRSSAQILRVLSAIVCIGAAVAVIAAAQDLTRAQGIYWCVPTFGGWARAGTFVLYNNFAQYMNLCLGAAIGLLLYCRFGASAAAHATGSSERRTRHHHGQRRLPSKPSTPWHAWRIGLLVGFIVLGACTVMLSESRGGMLSLFVCFFGLVLLLARHRAMKRQGWFLLVVGGVIFTTLLYIGFDKVCHRLETLHDSPNQASDGRIQYFKDIASIWRRFPLVGTGLGTHEYVYPAYDHSNDSGLAEQADGDYIQAAEEVGTAGLLLIAFFVAIIWRHFVSAAASVKPNGNRAGIAPVQVVAYGLGFGLLAVMIHSAVDFGQHLPAIGCLSATFCALIINLGASRPAKAAVDEPAKEIRSRFGPLAAWRSPSRLGALTMSLALVTATAWASASAYRFSRAAAYANHAADLAFALNRNDWQGDRAEYVALIQSAQDAVRAEPRDITDQYWLNCYRWEAISHPIGKPANSIELSAKGVEYASQIVAELNHSRLLCPCYGPTLAVMGQIEYFALGEREAALRHVELAYQLWPNHEEVCLAAGSIAAAENHWDAAMGSFDHCLQLGDSLYPQVLEILLAHQRWDQAVAISTDSPDQLLNVIRYLPRQGADANSLAERARRLAMDELNAQCAKPDAPAGVLAQTAYLYQDSGIPAQASVLFQRALALNYAEVEWRMRLAGLFKAQGKYSQAAHEARICLRLRPGMPAAALLLDQLNAMPNVRLDELDQ
jgi:tetratricopeptide (TPR) repeat protein